jgi:hypothetical protein
MIYMRVTNMEENTLSVDNICSIISLCSSSGVAELEFGALKVSFQDRRKPVDPIVIPSTFHGPESKPNDIIEDEQDAEEAASLEADLKALEMQNLILEDPTLAEEIEAMDEDQIEDFIERLKEGE